MKTLHPDLFPETLLVDREGDRVFTTSLKVAEHFNKKHYNVIRDIEKVIEDVRELGVSPLNFEGSDYQNERGKTYRMFKMDRKAFSVLAGRFIGKKALRWQIDFYDAFDAMERQLLAQKDRAENALYELRRPWRIIIQNQHLPRRRLIELTGHKSEGSITANRRRMRQVGLID